MTEVMINVLAACVVILLIVVAMLTSVVVKLQYKMVRIGLLLELWLWLYHPKRKEEQDAQT